MLLPFLTFIVLLGSCSHAQNQKAAVEVLNKRLSGDALRLNLFIGRVTGQCFVIPETGASSGPGKIPKYQAAQKAGIITITDGGPGLWTIDLVNPDPKIAAVLKKVPHEMKDGCDGFMFAVPVVRKSVVDLVNLQPITAEKSEAVYTWKWQLQPDGEKLVDKLSEQERLQLTPHLEYSKGSTPDPTFNLANLTAATAAHQDKKTLKKSGDGWVIDE